MEAGGRAGLIFRWQNGVPITTVSPPPSQVRSAFDSPWHSLL
jgi:hypothetical protein